MGSFVAMRQGLAAQVVALLLRSSGKVDAPLPEWSQEQDFAHMLNRVLPDTIRALGWADVPQDFHARCDAGFQLARWSRYE
jgi:tRNA U38,U39,U40 pseudouridine synthase TruA